jgi:tRNA(adenine34) deaminase
MKTDEEYMRMALQEAHKAEEDGEIPIGAVIVDKQGLCVARSHNQTEMLHDVTAHAEMLALTIAAEECGKYLTDCTLFVTVEPCIMCAGAIGWAQMGRVVYGATDPKRGFSLFSPSPLHPKCVVTAGILADDCGNLVSDFFKRKR